MKKIACLKLNQLSKAELEKREMNFLRGGGDSCSCGCHYVDSGGSSYEDNRKANWTYGYTSYGGGVPVTCSCPIDLSYDMSNDTNTPL